MILKNIVNYLAISDNIEKYLQHYTKSNIIYQFDQDCFETFWVINQSIHSIHHGKRFPMSVFGTE